MKKQHLSFLKLSQCFSAVTQVQLYMHAALWVDKPQLVEYVGQAANSYHTLLQEAIPFKSCQRMTQDTLLQCLQNVQV